MLEGKFLVKATFSQKKVRTDLQTISDLWGGILRTINEINATGEGELVGETNFSSEDYKIVSAMKPLILPYRIGFGGDISYFNYMDIESFKFKLDWSISDNKGNVAKGDYSNSDVLTPTEFKEAIGEVVDILTKGNDSVTYESISREGEHVGVENVDNFAVVTEGEIKTLTSCSTYPRVISIYAKAAKYYKVTADDEIQKDWAMQLVHDMRTISK